MTGTEGDKPSRETGTPSDAIGAQEKSASQLKKEAQKQEKLDKFRQKQEKLKQQKSSESKEKRTKPSSSQPQPAIFENTTPVGEKKDTSGPLPDSYNPQYVENAWYSWWEEKGMFRPTAKDSGQRFVMVIPPPNVTGSLHLGHALTVAIEDCVTRWHRMKGHETLWNPGCDHAGIATQVVVEKRLWLSERKTRHDLGREQFVSRVWDWKKEKGDRIYQQLRLMGASVDWDKATFTMDPKMSRAVTEAFLRLHETRDSSGRPLIYRHKRLVNWSCALRSAISDIEVDKMELSGRQFLSVPGYKDKVEFGVLVSFAYQLENGDGEIIVATTRVETMLGDVAIAVHPQDPRYTHLHGKRAVHPFIPNRLLPIVCDDFVDKEFGTGAVKITPAHDANDYEVGLRHQLAFITILDDDGLITSGCGQFSGMKRFDARKAVLNALKDAGLYRDSKDNPMVVPICNRSKDVVEPMLKYQWFVSCEGMAKKAADAVRQGKLVLKPDKAYDNTWFKWLDNSRDWCVSRQLWWGHRIPAYFATVIDHDMSAISEEERWFCTRSSQEAQEKAALHFGVSNDRITVEQDDDVLDTWFSSGLFPFAIFGWPDSTPDLAKFYPGHLLETGHDILFFWVARMVMLGLELTGSLPFKEVYLHPIVRDAHGRKMSKSLGNVVDPMHVIRGIPLEDLHETLADSNLDPQEVEKAKSGQKTDFPAGIPECGTDALRFALCDYLGQGRDINLDIKRVEGYRFFCNKLWNALKLTLSILGTESITHKPPPIGQESHLDLWLLSRLSAATDACNQGIGSYEFHQATSACYSFWLKELCDVYLEGIKPIIQGSDQTAKFAAQNTLLFAVDTGLRLLHPFMPFITEELYQRLPTVKKGTSPETSISVANYPQSESLGFPRNESLERNMDMVENVIHGIRSLRGDYTLAKNKVMVTIRRDEESALKIRPFFLLIKTVTYASEIRELSSNENSGLEGTAVIQINDKIDCFLHLKGQIDVEKERERIKSKKEKICSAISRLKSSREKSDYSEKVPVTVQEANRDKLSTAITELQKLEIMERSLETMS